GIPVIALAGGIAPEADAFASHGITAALPIGSGPMPLEQAMLPETALQGMRRTARELFRLIKAAQAATSKRNPIQ
ncbi:glycerate kinase, partial [Paenibacillus sp. CCS19]|uniref:glycerate kinase n=1 Tax=Paenibacillus sp. CCS19 TaxID=3158387 RepID=UPI00295E52AF